MKNKDLVKSIVRCEKCIHRGTDDCPMVVEYYDSYYGIWDITDNTFDNMFCSEGEKPDEGF